MPSGGRNAYDTLTRRWGEKKRRRRRLREASGTETPSRWLFTLLVFLAGDQKQLVIDGSKTHKGLLSLCVLRCCTSKPGHSHFIQAAKFTQHISPSNTSRQCPRRQSSGGAASLHFDVVNERQRPHGAAPCFYCRGPAGAPLTAGALVLTSAPSLCPLTSRGQVSELDGKSESVPSGMRSRWCGRGTYGVPQDSTSEEFSSGMFLPSPPSSVTRILYLTELWRPDAC